MTKKSTGVSAGVELLGGVLRGDGAVRSLREAYLMMTGDKEFSGQLRNCDAGRLGLFCGGDRFGRFVEAVTPEAFSNTLGAAVHRQMLAHYVDLDHLAAWRKVVRVVPAPDFRGLKGVVVGGYGNLPAVAEGGAYTPLTSPPERGYVVPVSKRGGSETITMEAIRNDDVGLFQQIAKELAPAAAHTLVETVLDFLKDNPLIYDGQALFHADHGNLGTAPLSAAGVMGAVTAMRGRIDPLTGRRNGALPKTLLVPSDLEETGFNIFQRTVNHDKTFVQSQRIEVVPVGYWTDANDWCLVGDPKVSPTIDLAFFDGKEDPEVIVSDMPTTGSLFANDAITLKIRHIYGAAVADRRSFYKSAPL